MLRRAWSPSPSSDQCARLHQPGLCRRSLHHEGRGLRPHGRRRCQGPDKAENAAKAAISSPLLETSIAGAHGVIINITSSPDIGLEDVETAASIITQSAHPDANIIFGAAFDEDLSDEMRVTVVATGFDNKRRGGPIFTQSFSTGMDTPVAAQPAAPAEEEDDGDYFDDLLSILNKRS